MYWATGLLLIPYGSYCKNYYPDSGDTYPSQKPVSFLLITYSNAYSEGLLPLLPPHCRNIKGIHSPQTRIKTYL